MRRVAERYRREGKSVALVPTMGALHEGHTALIDDARKRAEVVITTIFVNPTQFGPNEDFDKYPRSFDNDCDLCKKHGTDIVFAPPREAIYPPNFSTYINEEKLSKGLCGVSRPGHFRGVCTIVGMLFNICQPTMAIFGQKDAQQSAIIKKMVSDLHIPVEIIIAPTVREKDGLAMSSRNRYLTDSQRNEALKIHEALQKGKALVDKGFYQVDRIEAEVTNHLIGSRRVRVIYVATVNRETMEPVRTIEPGKCLIAVACWVDETRLIDNFLL